MTNCVAKNATLRAACPDPSRRKERWLRMAKQLFGSDWAAGDFGEQMKDWEKFGSYKERGEWVELQFMAKAAQRRFAVCKPWGDVRAYDVGIEHGQNFLRVQVKSTTCRVGAGYLCQLLPHHQKKQDYTLKQLDLFAAYVIPANAWYLIPAAVVLGWRRITTVCISPVMSPVKKKSYCYECYREAWSLLKKSREELVSYAR